MCKINGKKLAELRNNAGISQKKLGEKVGLSQSTIKNYESGTSEPTSETVSKICMILEANRDDIEIRDVSYNVLRSEGKVAAKLIRQKEFKRYSTPSETEKYIENFRTVSQEEETKEVINAIKNSFGIGSKRYILIDPKYIHIPEWQRDTDMAKATEIAKNFDDNKYDPVKVYASNGKLIVADGAHRIIAFIINGELKILVEILTCDEHDAILTFLDQESGRKPMSVNDTYRAGIKANIKEYVQFKELFESYNIQITADEHKIENPIGEIRPSRSILRMVKSDRETLVKTIELIKKLDWCGSEKNPFVLRNFKVIKRLYATFGENLTEKTLMEFNKGAFYYEYAINPIKNDAALFDKLVPPIDFE